MQITQFDQIPTDVTVLNDEFSLISFTLPTDSIRPFMFMFQSLASLMQTVQWKHKTDLTLIQARNEKKQAAIDERVLNCNVLIIDTFKQLISEGKEPREALSLTIKKAQIDYGFASYDYCKKLLIKNKYVKNTGFYKSRHKID